MSKSFMWKSFAIAVGAALSTTGQVALAGSVTLSVSGCNSLTVIGVTSSAISLSCDSGSASGSTTTPPPPPPTTTPSTPPPTSGAWTGTCAGYTKTLYREFDWASPGNMLIDTASNGQLGSNGVLVGSFVTPATPGYTDAMLNVKVTPYPGNSPMVSHTLILSEGAPACDLAFTAGYGRETSSSGSLSFVYDGASTWGFSSIKPNTRYFVTVANRRGGVNTCASYSSCDVRLEITRPAGI